MAFRNIGLVVMCLCLVGAAGCKKNTLPGASLYPTITDFSPQSAGVNTTVTLNGSGFDGVTNVTVGGAQATFQHINFNQLTLQIPTNAATGIIAVVNSEGSAGTTQVVNGVTVPAFFYVTPSITTISPTSGSPGTTVTITGYGLQGTQQVVFGTGASANFFVNNANQIQAVVPLVSTTGPITVTVPGATSAMTAPSPSFTFSDGGVTAPVLSSFSPAQGVAGDPVTLIGTGFTYVSAVTIGGVSCYATPASDTTINVQVPPGAVSGLITVTSGLGSSTSATAFSVVPAVTSFTPAQGPAGTLVTLKGSGFVGATGITFGGKAASGFIVLDANNAQANVAPGSATGPIVVTGPGVSGQSATPFTFIADATGLPVITSLTPVQALTGAEVDLAGSGFLSVTDVFVGTLEAPATFTASSDVALSLTVPANAQSGFISATNALGTSASATTFTVVPTLTAVSPLAGPVGTTVTLTGTGFVGATSVLFTNGVAAPFVVVDANHITTQVPAGAVSGGLSVVSSGITCTSDTSNSFTVQTTN